MHHTRWYDQDLGFKFVVDTLESLDDETKTNVANELVQIIVQLKSPNFDDFLMVSSTETNKTGRRWYDGNYIVQSAIEMIKHVDNQEKIEVLKEALYSIMHFKETKMFAASGDRY